jgi:hypothetical protein
MVGSFSHFPPGDARLRFITLPSYSRRELIPFSYFCTGSNETPSFLPSASWLRPRVVRPSHSSADIGVDRRRGLRCSLLFLHLLHGYNYG